MIAHLKGEILSHDEEALILEVQGVGYELYCSQHTLDQAMNLKESSISLFVHTHVREDALHLYGFAWPNEKRMFLALTKVNGIGPKMAMRILTGAKWDKIAEMIESEDVRSLSTLPKVGKKTAEQMILTLKGKLGLSELAAPSSSPHHTHYEIVSALVNLGYRLSDVEKVVSQMSAQVDVQTGVREGLRLLSTHF